MVYRDIDIPNAQAILWPTGAEPCQISTIVAKEINILPESAYRTFSGKRNLAIAFLNQDMSRKRGLKRCVSILDGLLLMVSAGAMGSGVYVLQAEYGAIVTSVLTGSRLYELSAYLLIASGAMSLMAALGGCVLFFESCNKNFFLGCHSSLLILIFLLSACGGIIGLLFKLSVMENFEDKLKETLIFKYGFKLDEPEHRAVTDVWNVMQRRLQCCGVNGNVNSTTSWAVYKLESKWYTQFVTGRPYVPDTCCKPFKNDNICTGFRPWVGVPRLGPPDTFSSMKHNPNINTNGCAEQMYKFPQRDIWFVLLFSAVITTISILDLTLSLCLCKGPTQYDFR